MCMHRRGIKTLKVLLYIKFATSISSKYHFFLLVEVLQITLPGKTKLGDCFIMTNQLYEKVLRGHLAATNKCKDISLV